MLKLHSESSVSYKLWLLPHPTTLYQVNRDSSDPQRTGKLEQKKSPSPLGTLQTICDINTSHLIHHGLERSLAVQLTNSSGLARHMRTTVGFPGTAVSETATTQRPACVFCLSIQRHISDDCYKTQLNDY